MKYFQHRLTFVIAAFIIILSCTSDDAPIEDVVMEATCSDGIQNGNETGIDCGWSCSNSCFAVNGLEGMLVRREVLDSSIEYRLTGTLIIRDGGILEIPAGTTIKAEPGTNASIVVAQGGKIYIYGQPDNPVVITSGSDNPAPGDWGGLVICGKAKTNAGNAARSSLVDLFYGGDFNTDSSGVLRYLRLEYTGANYDEATKFSALSLFGAGSFTTVEYVQSIYGQGDGFTIHGGTVNANWLVATDHGENAVSLNEGWFGKGEFWYLSGAEKTGINITNNRDDASLSPTTQGNISNVSIIGPASQGAVGFSQGGGIMTVDSLYTSTMSLGIGVTGAEAIGKIDLGAVNIDAIQFDSVLSDFVPTDYTGPNTTFYTEGDNLGAGNGSEIPDWAIGWTRGI